TGHFHQRQHPRQTLSRLPLHRSPGTATPQFRHEIRCDSRGTPLRTALQFLYRVFKYSRTKLNRLERQLASGEWMSVRGIGCWSSLSLHQMDCAITFTNLSPASNEAPRPRLGRLLKRPPRKGISLAPHVCVVEGPKRSDTNFHFVFVNSWPQQW